MDKLIEDLRSIFAENFVNVEKVSGLLAEYKSNEEDWAPYALFDPHRYTRNLVDIGNGKYNLMILCWGPGMGSSIHDHTDSHCFVKMLQGDLLETQFEWPREIEKINLKNTSQNHILLSSRQNDDKSGPMKEIGQNILRTNAVAYISDEIGLHRMENLSHSETAVSMHLYIPPFDHCNMFDQRSGKKSACTVTFWSEFGEKVDVKKKMQEQKHKSAVHCAAKINSI